MKHLSTLSAALLMAVGCMAAGTLGKVSYAQKLKKTGLHNFVSVPGMVNRSNAALQMQKAGFAQLKNAPSRVEGTEDASNSFSSEGYGWVTSTDGTNWYFTQESTYRDSVYSEYYTAHYYETSTITVYNNSHQQVGQFTVQVPAGWTHVTGIEPYGPITNKLFDFDAKSNEILVEFHEAYLGSTRYLTRAYDISTGEIKFEKEGTGVVFQSAANSWSVYNRLIMTNETDSTYNVDVIAPPTWGQTKAYVEKSFSFDVDNRINYLQSPCFNCFDVDGTPYYVITRYDKPFTDTDAGDGTQDIVQTQDNYVTLCTYDKKFNKVDSLAVSINVPDGATYRSAAFGLFGNKDLSKGYYSTGDKLNYVVELLDYIPALDADLASFAVYDSEHGKLKDICDKVTSSQWGMLNTIHGKSDQMWFLQTLGTGENAAEQLQLVDVPSCNQVTYLSQEIEGNSISSNFDRYATTTNSYGYQYVIALASAELDEDSCVQAPVAWVNPDRTIDHIDRLNLGKSAEYFTPLINSTSLNPYLFNTDDDMEYVYIAKKRRTDGSNKVDNVLEVAKTDGTVLKSWRGDDDNVFTTASLPQMNENGKMEMMVCFKNYTSDKYDVSFYDLPFSKFTEGGDGSKEDPYLIATVGDLQQVFQAPDKAYKLVSDLDMSKSASYWTPIKSFTGVLDGNGYSIYNLGIKTTDSNAGFFGTLDNLGIVKNLTFVKPTIELTSNNQYAGIVAGESSYDYTGAGTDVNVDSVFVYDANISGTADANIGGLVGCQSLYSTVAASSFQGSIYAPNASMVGGIAGKQRTSSTVTASYADVTAVASSSLGGIVGEAGSTQDGCTVTNCEVRGSLTAENNVGGIMGYSYANRIKNCITHADIKATNPASWGGYAAGGIVGGLDPDWSASGTYTVINNCVFAGTVKAIDADGAEVSNPATTHLIVGKTIADETYEAGETPQTETRIKDNYTTTDAGNTDAASVEGAYKAAKEMDKTFFESLGYAYGTTKAEPWKEQGNIPTLYFNNIAKALFVSSEDVTVGTTDEGNAVITVSVYGVDNIDLESDLDVTVNNKNATVELGKADGNTIQLTIKGQTQGFSTLTIAYGDLKAQVMVTVLKNYVSGIDEAPVADAFTIKADAGELKAEGADRILVYGISGQLVGKTDGASFSTLSLAGGVYVAKATDKAGNKATLKFVVK